MEDAPYPLTLYLADLCEAFPGRLPSEVVAEVERLPVGLLEEVLEARAYRHAVAMRESAEQSASPAEAIKRLPRTRLLGLVPEIDMAVAMERRGDGVHSDD